MARWVKAGGLPDRPSLMMGALQHLLLHSCPPPATSQGQRMDVVQAGAEGLTVCEATRYGTVPR